MPPPHLDIKPTYNPPHGHGDFDFTSPKSGNKVELPVYHEKSRSRDHSQWRDTATADTSPMVRSPESASFVANVGRNYGRYSPQVSDGGTVDGWGSAPLLQGKPPIHQQYHQQPPPQSPLQGAGYSSYAVKYDHVPVPVLHIESHHATSQHHGAGGGYSPQPTSPTSPPPAQSTLVTVKRNQPHMEVTKPYETSDFF